MEGLAIGLCVAVTLTVPLVILARKKPQESLRLVRSAFNVVIGPLGILNEAAQQALSFSLTFWRQHLAEGFGVRPLVGGLLLLSMVTVATFAEVELLTLAIEVLYGVGMDLEEVPLWGTISVARLASYSFVFVGVALAHGALEFLGFATLFSGVVGRTAPWVRKLSAALCCLLLIAVCAVQAAAGVIRVVKSRQLEEIAAVEEVELGWLGGEDPAPQAIEGEALANEETSGWARFADDLPLWIQATFGFVLPLVVSIGGAVASELVLMNVLGIALALPIGLMMVPALLARLILTVVAAVATVAENVIETAAPASAPETAAELLTPAAEPPPVSGANEPARYTSDVSELGEAWRANPLDIPQELWGTGAGAGTFASRSRE
jgi:hypothetical protein